MISIKIFQMNNWDSVIGSVFSNSEGSSRGHEDKNKPQNPLNKALPPYQALESPQPSISRSEHQDQARSENQYQARSENQYQARSENQYQARSEHEYVITNSYIDLFKTHAKMAESIMKCHVKMTKSIMISNQS
jgi:hypothetical protein